MVMVRWARFHHHHHFPHQFLRFWKTKYLNSVTKKKQVNFFESFIIYCSNTQLLLRKQNKISKKKYYFRILKCQSAETSLYEYFFCDFRSYCRWVIESLPKRITLFCSTLFILCSVQEGYTNIELKWSSEYYCSFDEVIFFVG